LRTLGVRGKWSTSDFVLRGKQFKASYRAEGVDVAKAFATTRSANWRLSSDFARSYSTYATGNPKHFGSGGTREIAG